MKICFVSHSARTGGAEDVLIETLEVLIDRGIYCWVILPERGNLCEELKRLRVPFCIIPYGYWRVRGKQSFWAKGKAVVRHLATIPMIVWQLKKWRCDVVYSNTSTICVGAIAAALLRKPHVWHIHEFGYEDHGLLFLFGDRFSLKVMDRLSSTCICPSIAVRDKYARYITPSKLKTLYCSMHNVRGKGNCKQHKRMDLLPRKHSIRCVIVGSVVEGKGQEDAVNAIAVLSRSNLKADLLIVGNDYLGYAQHLKRIIKHYGLEEQVSFVGHVDDAFPFIESSDVALVCSKCEAFGRVTVEAMLAGKPVIGAQSGATSELIEEGFNGLFYIPGDFKSLAHKIKYLYERPEVARRIGENGKKWAEPIFKRDRYANELIKLFAMLAKTIPR